MPRARPAFDLEHYPFFWMTRVIAARDGMLARELKDLGLRVPEWRVLALVYARKRLPMKELADLSSIDRTTLTRTVDRMVEGGLLVRMADSNDLRVTWISLTAAGEKLFARSWPTVENLNRAAIDGLPPGAVDLLGWIVSRMERNLARRATASEVTVREDLRPA